MRTSSLDVETIKWQTCKVSTEIVHCLQALCPRNAGHCTHPKKSQSWWRPPEAVDTICPWSHLTVMIIMSVSENLWDINLNTYLRARFQITPLNHFLLITKILNYENPHNVFKCTLNLILWVVKLNYGVSKGVHVKFSDIRNKDIFKFFLFWVHLHLPLSRCNWFKKI